MPFSTFFSALPESLSGWALLIATVCFLKGIFNMSTSPLNQYPGPWLARYTNLWRLWAVRSGDYHLKIKKLHDEYGSVVRIGPDALDFDLDFGDLNGRLKSTIYDLKGEYTKGGFYLNNSIRVFLTIVYHMFSTPNNTDKSED
ncbi:hypothetical protein LX36DRAFT_112655 [Colletotrichum falcatum]|nr:hypothetical protein LX36DRAFT_112655 [Colletotrichum falcatum]